ncbi:MAG: 4Fe-4S dicluster domain-containing protein [bacterium]
MGVKMLAVYPEKCTGCMMCELACSMKKTGAFNPAESRIHAFIFPEEFHYIPLACFQCEDPPCQRACPTRAISKSPTTGIVEIDDGNCIGCKMCVLACPFGTMGFSSEAGVAVKCDLCDGEPECAKFCAPRALELKEAEVSMLSREREFAERIQRAYREVRV